MNVFLATLALTSHRQLMSCDEYFGMLTGGVALSDSACKTVASNQGLEIDTCDQLCREVFFLEPDGGGGGGGVTAPDVPDDTDVGVGQDDGDDEDPCESKCPEGKCEGVCESEADINKPECADYVACNSDLGNATEEDDTEEDDTEEDDTEEDDVRAPHHHRQRPAPEPPPPPRRPPPPDSVYRLSFPRTTSPLPARASAAR